MRGRRQTSVCAGCHDEILDQYILRVSPDLEWHVGCLRCTHCQQALDETSTCFVRDEQPYCKRDYVRYVDSKHRVPEKKEAKMFLSCLLLTLADSDRIQNMVF